MNKGWVKLHRKLLDNPALIHDKTAFVVFVSLLLLVDRETGELNIGRNKLGALLDVNPSTLYSCIRKLSKNGMISVTVINRAYSTYCIRNWDEYQQPVNNSSTTRQHLYKKEELRIKNKHIGFSFANKELEVAFDEFGLMRKTIKKPVTLRAAELVIGRLEKLYPNQPNMQLQSLNQSIEHCWQTVYPIKVDPSSAIARQREQPKPEVEISEEQRSKNLAKMAEIRKQLADKGIIKKSIN
jgi:hypothetical protein